MDNASKNASDMISSLQMKYNRGRQAAITNELVDIITGSSSSPRFSLCCTEFDRSLDSVYYRCQCFVNWYQDGGSVSGLSILSASLATALVQRPRHAYLYFRWKNRLQTL